MLADILAPQATWRWRGIVEGDLLSETTLGYLGITNKQQEQLISMNDEKGNTFEEIADWIEANL